ncbi:MAG: GIY-YIG nuclease family protein [Chloroflexota bacterium]
MFLEYGVSKHGELVYIDQVARGATALQCPYCGGLLTAKKGEQVAYHFAHTGETCRQVDRNQETIALPCYDNFNLHLPGKALKALRDFHDDEDVAERQLAYLENEFEVLRYNEWAGRGGNWELTKKGKIPFGELSLMLFNQFQEPLIVQKHDELEAVAAQAKGTVDFATYLTDLHLYRAQLRRILSVDLYFLKINDGVLYKVGVTHRAIQQRIAEIQADLAPHIGPAQVEVIGLWPGRGNVELYFKHRYKASGKPLGTLTEYFTFENPKAVLLDLRRMKPKQFTPLETAILAGTPSDLERAIEAEDIEERRRAGIRSGMQRAARRGTTIGRPAGVIETPDMILAKYPDAAAAIQTGLSLREAASLAGVSVNTIRKVKAALMSTDWREHSSTFAVDE